MKMPTQHIKKYCITLSTLAIFFVALFAQVQTARADTTITVFLTSGTSWTVPNDWNNSNNSIEVIGGGGGGAASPGGGSYGAGGGGGAYSKSTNVSLTGGASVSYVVGTGGATSTAGTDTYFNGASCAAASVCAKGGTGGSGTTAGAGGTTGGIGGTKYAGGAGGAGASGKSGGGGGAAGPHGAGGVGTSAAYPSNGGKGGTGDNTNGGAGCDINNPNVAQTGTQWGFAYGSGGGGCGFLLSQYKDAALYGGGGGGALSNAAGRGAQGIIVITYLSIAPQISSLSPINTGYTFSTSPSLVLNFSDAVTAVAAKNIVIKKYSDDSTIETIAANGGHVSVSGTQVTITPTSTLTPGTRYYVLIDSGAFQRSDNSQPFVGITSKTAWNFTVYSSATATARTYDAPGTYTFTIPSHTSITVYVYGAGGGGSSDSNFENLSFDGGYSAFDDGGGHQIRAEGGGGVNDDSENYDEDCQGVPYGAGGTASGGTTNTTGANGGETGGTAFQVATSPSCQDPAGWGGANNGPLGGAQADSVSNGSTPGYSYGGGGSGVAMDAYYSAIFGDSYTARLAGGGGGGYAARTWSSGTFTPGSMIQVTVGAGGAGASNVGFGAGGDGADGLVAIIWEAPSGSAPTVATNFAGAVDFHGGTLVGSITDAGGSDATAYGFAYSTNSTLSSSVSTTTLGTFSGTGSFNQRLDSLTASATYYFRAYATNSAGTGYGSIVSFTTGNSTISRSIQLFEGATVKFFGGTLKLYPTN